MRGLWPGAQTQNTHLITLLGQGSQGVVKVGGEENRLGAKKQSRLLRPKPNLQPKTQNLNLALQPPLLTPLPPDPSPRSQPAEVVVGHEGREVGG